MASKKECSNEENEPANLASQAGSFPVKAQWRKLERRRTLLEQVTGFERFAVKVASLIPRSAHVFYANQRVAKREATGLPYNSHETGCRNVGVFCEEIDGFALVLNTRAVATICRSCISPMAVNPLLRSITLRSRGRIVIR